MTLKFQLGDITIHRIIEDESPFEEARKFLPALSADMLAENRHWMAPAALDADDRLIFCMQSYIVQTPHKTVMIDTCVGNDKERPSRANWHQQKGDRYTRNLASAGFAPDDIDVVMCTHLHVDHVGWNTRLENGAWVPTFPKARYLFADQELAYWSARHAQTPNPVLVDSVLPIIAAGRADIVRSDHEVDDHIRLISTPGHTPDHFAVQIGRGRTDAVMTGDLIHTPLQARYPELAMRGDTDPAQGITTRQNFLETYCDTNTLCCTSHFPSPSIVRIKRWDQGFRCDAIT